MSSQCPLGGLQVGGEDALGLLERELMHLPRHVRMDHHGVWQHNLALLGLAPQTPNNGRQWQTLLAHNQKPASRIWFS